MNSPIVVANASLLIAFGRLNFLSILTQTLGSVIIPDTVAKECTQDRSRSGAMTIQNAIDSKVLTIYANPQTDHFFKLSALLGKGESAAIALAIELQASLLIDEKIARAAAQELNLKVIGTAGVFVIDAVMPVIKQLKEEGYYLSDALIREICKLSAEDT